jgi:AcrR family transcriptional regulator
MRPARWPEGRAVLFSFHRSMKAAMPLHPHHPARRQVLTGCSPLAPFAPAFRHLLRSEAAAYTSEMDEAVHLPVVASRSSRRKSVAGPVAAASRPKARAGGKAPPAATRTNDPVRTMSGILDVATTEFAEKGLSGARIDEIAAATRTSKRMIYYYFGSKEGLYLAVLEESYRRMRAIEAEQRLEDLAPEAALRRLVEFTFDHHQGNPDYIRLVMNENMQRGEYLRQSRSIQELNVPAIEAIQLLYERGVTGGVFRPGLDPIDIHASISALTFFNVSNQHTFGLIFKQDGQTRKALAARKRSIVELIVRFVRL